MYRRDLLALRVHTSPRPDKYQYNGVTPLSTILGVTEPDNDKNGLMGPRNRNEKYS